MRGLLNNSYLPLKVLWLSQFLKVDWKEMIDGAFGQDVRARVSTVICIKHNTNRVWCGTYNTENLASLLL